MNYRNTHPIGAITKGECATSEDFRKLFTEDMNSLYLLSFLLTASHEQAERCFVAGLADCVDGNPVFKEWARSWARCIIVRNAIRIIAPHTDPVRLAASAPQSKSEDNITRMPLQDTPLASILELEDFERFVYVLSVLERYPAQACAVLLDTSIQTIQETRIGVLQHTADFANRERVRQRGRCQPEREWISREPGQAG
jgi:hypothetical protein